MTDPFSPTPPPPPSPNQHTKRNNVHELSFHTTSTEKQGFADVSFKRHKLSLFIKVKVVSKERCGQEGHNKLQIQYQIFPLPQSIHKANWKRNLAVYRHQWALVKRNQNNEGFRHGKHFQFLSS